MDDRERTGDRSPRVRIIGAEPAVKRIEPDVPDVPDVPEEPVAEEPVLPHWTEAPTGEVPAILAHDTNDETGDDDPWSAMPGPSWREERADWDAHEDTFDASMLAHEDSRKGSLDESDDTERRPWEFELGKDATDLDAEEATPLATEFDGEDEDPPPVIVEPLRRATRQHSAPRPRPSSRPSSSSEPRQSDRNIPVAVVSGIVVGCLALGLFKLGNATALGLVVVVVVLAAVEVFAAFRRGGYAPATLLGLVAIVSVLLASYAKGQAAMPLVLAMLVAFTFLWHLSGVDRNSDPIFSVTSTLFVFCWIGVLGSFAALLLNPTLFPRHHGIAFLLGAVITVVAYDVGALAFGMWLGKHQLSPKVSPGKTWEGSIGGAAIAMLAALTVVRMIDPWTIGAAATLGLSVSIISPIGDLSESLIKRTLGVKDMGRFMPGHGGIMDRVDGLLFILPATYYIAKAFHLG